MTPKAFATFYVFKFEDGEKTDPNKTHSLDPDDNGNWTGGRRNVGALVGSNHGVTPKALATFRKVPVASITRATMHALTIAEATDIALALYYHAPGLDQLPWDRVMPSVFDFGWGSGPTTGVVHLQRVLGLKQDGNIGPVTIAAYVAWIVKYGEGAAALLWQAERDRFYEALIAADPVDSKYRKNWHARAAYFTSAEFQHKWSA